MRTLTHDPRKKPREGDVLLRQDGRVITVLIVRKDSIVYSPATVTMYRGLLSADANRMFPTPYRWKRLMKASIVIALEGRRITDEEDDLLNGALGAVVRSSRGVKI